jgi:hypothetical protein
VIGAVAKGDLAQNMALEIDDRPLTGEFLRTAKVVNTTVDQLSTFASEVTRVAVKIRQWTHPTNSSRRFAITLQ